MHGIYLTAIITTGIAIFGPLIHKLKMPANVRLLWLAALHWLCNFPILLMAWNVGGLGKTFWTVVIQFWLFIYFVGAVALLSYFTFGRVAPGRMIFGVRRCPECDHDYDAPLFGLNFGPRRYERCPHCRHWHWTKAFVRTSSMND